MMLSSSLLITFVQIFGGDRLWVFLFRGMGFCVFLNYEAYIEIRFWVRLISFNNIYILHVIAFHFLTLDMNRQTVCRILRVLTSVKGKA